MVHHGYSGILPPGTYLLSTGSEYCADAAAHRTRIVHRRFEDGIDHITFFLRAGHQIDNRLSYGPFSICRSQGSDGNL
ncbi:hypothetical protein BG74_00220 [Sodalis-like endosymbiont of Proechinophthirus fluctus]|nr:hypothetical protein BG74_00220 [Sodalis-like endosymbiont of Proechinophthirus fluctus]